jgi:uncharacterized protein Smg (DUF494 family)
MIDFVIHIKELEIDNGKKLVFIVLYRTISKKPNSDQLLEAIFDRTQNKNRSYFFLC